MDGPAAIEHLTDAYETLADPADRMQVAHGLCRALLFTGSLEEASRFTQRVAADLPDLEDDGRALAAFDLMLGFFGVEAPQRLHPLDAHRDRPATASAPRCWRPSRRCGGRRRGGSADDCAELALASLAGGELPSPTTGSMMMAAMMTLVVADRPEVDPEWAFAQSEAHRHGSICSASPRSTSGTASRCCSTESWPRRRTRCAKVRRNSTRGDSTTSPAVTRAAFLARATLERGRIDEARQWLDRSPPASARTRMAAATGARPGSGCWRPRGAPRRRSRRSPTSSVITRHVRLPASMWARSHAALALDRLGRRDEAIALAEEELADARRWGAPGTVGPSLRVVGVLRGDVELLQEAVDVLERSHARLELAKALADLGSVLRRERGPSDAREPLRRALELADACSADGLVEHMRSELYAAGARPRTTALGGVDALTASERRVAAFAAEGQSNRDIAQALFVTPKTVEVHLSNAYRKLGIRSRRELAGALPKSGGDV